MGYPVDADSSTTIVDEDSSTTIRCMGVLEKWFIYPYL